MKLSFNSKYRTFPAPQKVGFLVSLINQDAPSKRIPLTL